MESIRKQFSLDWLPGSKEGGRRERSPLTDSSLGEARDFIYSSSIGNHLYKAAQRTLKLHDLARLVRQDVEQFKFEECWEVIRSLAERGYVEISDIQDPDGNYTIKLSRI